MCQEGAGHVGRRDYDVRTLPEPKVAVKRVAGGRQSWPLPELQAGRRPEAMPMASIREAIGALELHASPVAVPTVSAVVRGKVDVVSGPVAGGVNQVGDEAAKAVARGRESGEDEPEGEAPEPESAALAGKAGAVQAAPIDEPNDVSRLTIEASDALFGKIYEILTNPKFSGKPDLTALVLAEALGVMLPASRKNCAQDRTFVARLRRRILEVASINGVDEAAAIEDGLLPDFMAKV